MSKIAMVQVYTRILTMHSTEIEQREAANHQVIGYDFATFKSDMYAGDLISTIGTVRTKWDKMISDRVLEIPKSCKPYTRGILWIDSLRAAAEGRRLVRATLPRAPDANVCVSDGFIYENQGDVKEGAQ